MTPAAYANAKPARDPAPETWEDAKAEYGETFATMQRAALEEVACCLLADANRLRRELDEATGVIR